MIQNPTLGHIYHMIQNPTLGHIFGENHNSKSYMHPMFIAALFTIAKTWKQPKCLSTEE